MASAPKFASTPRLEYLQISTANTNRDGTGTVTSLITGVSAGTKVDKILAKSTGTTTAGMLRFYLSLDGGTTKRLITELPVAAVTPSSTAAAWEGQVDFSYMNFILRDASAQILASTEKAETFNLVAIGGDLT
jgi:hypothetical protein